MEMNIGEYNEHKPNFIRLALWRVAEKTLWLFPSAFRIGLLRVFGAKVGRRCLICRGAKFYAPWNFECGDFVCVGPRAEIYCKGKVSIGSQVIVSQDSYICTASHDISSPMMNLLTKPIKIGSNVWIAAKATLLPGVEVGEGAVVGACAVVAKNVPAWSVVVGNPARVVKQRKLCKQKGDE